MWFLKRANITGFRADQAYDGTDWRTNRKVKNWSVSNTPPSAADAGNYFYLPTFGGYTLGRVSGVGYTGVYWSSSAASLDSGKAYNLIFGSGYVAVGDNERSTGYMVGAFE